MFYDNNNTDFKEITANLMNYSFFHIYIERVIEYRRRVVFPNISDRGWNILELNTF